MTDVSIKTALRDFEESLEAARDILLAEVAPPDAPYDVGDARENFNWQFRRAVHELKQALRELERAAP